MSQQRPLSYQSKQFCSLPKPCTMLLNGCGPELVMKKCMLMDSFCHRIHDDRLVHLVSTKSSTSGLVSNFFRSRIGFACLPPFPLSFKEIMPKDFSPRFRHQKHRSNGTTTLALLRICGYCTCTRMVDQRELRGLKDPVLYY